VEFATDYEGGEFMAYGEAAETEVREEKGYEDRTANEVHFRLYRSEFPFLIIFLRRQVAEWNH
jgi:hypothetical protein